MKARKITLAVAAAALALPVALTATASTASASGIPPLCSNPTYASICQTANNAHTATFSGIYHASTHSFNDTNESPGACAVGSGAASLPLCRFTFTGGDPKKACTPNTTTPWYQAPPGSDAWTFYPDKGDASKSNGGNRLFAQGGGVIDDTQTTTDSYGNILVYRVHIQIHALCGNENTAQGLVDNITADAGLGSVDLSKAYRFDGYYDIV